MPRRLLAVTLLLSVLFSACNKGSTPGPTIDITIAAPDGGDPLTGSDVDTAHVMVQQGSKAPASADPSVTGGAVDLSFSFDDSIPVRLALSLTGPTTHLVGAVPPFLSSETGGFLRIIVGTASSCAVIPDATLASPASLSGVAAAGTFVLAVGGEGSAGASGHAGYVDLLRWLPGSFDDLPDPLGPARAAALDDTHVLIVSAMDVPRVFDLTSTGQRTTPLSLHPGANDHSALVPLGLGVAVVGGGSSDTPSSGISWVTPDGTTHQTALMTPRADAAAAPFAGGLLVAGGAAAGAPLAEVADPALPTARALLAGIDDGVRRGAALFLDAAGARALLVGGVDGTGAPRADTWLLEGCPDACRATAGPTWDDARAGAASVALPGGGGLLLGGQSGADPTRSVDRILFDPSGARIEPSTPLAAARSDARAFTLGGSGIVVVVGGRDVAGPRGDVEACFPDQIALP